MNGDECTGPKAMPFIFKVTGRFSFMQLDSCIKTKKEFLPTMKFLQLLLNINIELLPTCHTLSVAPTGSLTCPRPTAVQGLPGHYNLFGILGSPRSNGPILQHHATKLCVGELIIQKCLPFDDIYIDLVNLSSFS